MSAKNIDDQDFENQPSDVTDSSYDEPYEDDVTYSEDDSDEWSEDTDLSLEEDDAEQQPPAKKKSSALTIAIILVVAVIAVFGFMILTGDNTPPESAADAHQASLQTENADQQPEGQQTNISDLKDQADQIPQGDQAVAPEQVPAVTPVVPQQGLMEDPTLLSQSPNVPADLSANQSDDQAPASLSEPAPATAGADLMATPEAPTPQPADVVAAISPTVKPVSDFPTVDSIKKPADTAIEAVPVEPAPAPIMTAADPVLPVPVQDNKSAQLQEQVDAGQSKIALLEKQLADQAAELEAQKQRAAKAASVPAAPVGASAAEVDALRSKIADLEEKLADKPAKAVVIERSSVDEDDYSVDAEPVKKPVVAAKPKAVAKQWVLKSAGAGKAILSDKATGDLKTVRVGDSVAGLGRIVSISESNSVWIVKGTAGSVSE